MSRIKKAAIFPRNVTTTDKINITSLTLALADVTKDEVFTRVAAQMTESLYSKTKDRAYRRADAILAVLNSHG